MAAELPSIWSTARHSLAGPPGEADRRTHFESDYDRLLFSTPVRRLADKTQVFPLEKHDSVRTRLTHSHEVANIARSIGTRLIRTHKGIFGADKSIEEAAPTILAAVGLAHDLGNPPFGHQGETVIGRWFEQRTNLFTEGGEHVAADEFVAVPPHVQRDFLKFEGNAQTIRLVARLQNTAGPSGLNLTAATLAALMKYTVSSDLVAKEDAATKKFGFFHSEQNVVDWVRSKTGLEAGTRHPLTWIMEAGDDIAYSVLDVEDAIKKGIVSPEDLLAFLRRKFEKTDLGGLINQIEEDFKKADAASDSLSRVREVKASYLRTRIMERLITGAANAYYLNKSSIFNFSHKKSLLESSNEESKLCKALKEFATTHAYNNPSVLEVELKGALVLDELMTCIWESITHREKFLDLKSRRTSPKASYVYSLISDNYRWNFEGSSTGGELPVRYHEMQLLTDMISGMTDGFAMQLYERIRKADGG